MKSGMGIKLAGRKELEESETCFVFVKMRETIWMKIKRKEFNVGDLVKKGKKKTSVNEV